MLINNATEQKTLLSGRADFFSKCAQKYQLSRLFIGVPVLIVEAVLYLFITKNEP